MTTSVRTPCSLLVGQPGMVHTVQGSRKQRGALRNETNEQHLANNIMLMMIIIIIWKVERFTSENLRRRMYYVWIFMGLLDAAC